MGKVKAIELAPPDARIDGYDTTEAVMEIRPEFAPISTDARAILRQKTLLGETYIELTSGTEPGESAPVSLGAAATSSDTDAADVEAIPEDGLRSWANPERDPDRRDLQRARSRDACRLPGVAAVGGSGRPGPRARPERLVRKSRPVHHRRFEIRPCCGSQKEPLRGLVRDTGEVFEALSERDQQLAGAITGSEATFGALADADEALPSRSRSCRPSSENRVRRFCAWTSSRPIRAHWCRSCCPSRTTSARPSTASGASRPTSRACS